MQQKGKSAGEWNVIASPQGLITDPRDGKKYGYLFWEAKRKDPYQIDAQNSFCVSSDEVDDFLEEKLAILGLNWKESNDFVVYWLPTLKQNKFSLIKFLEKEYTDDVALDITPKPDTIIRVFMIFKAVPERIATTPPTLQQVVRKGFVAVEWGGMNLDEEGPYQMQP